MRAWMRANVGHGCPSRRTRREAAACSTSDVYSRSASGNRRRRNIPVAAAPYPRPRPSRVLAAFPPPPRRRSREAFSPVDSASCSPFPLCPLRNHRIEAGRLRYLIKERGSGERGGEGEGERGKSGRAKIPLYAAAPFRRVLTPPLCRWCWDPARAVSTGPVRRDGG